VVDTTTPTILTAHAGCRTSITFDGISIKPKASGGGDTFGIVPSSDQSVFTTVQAFLAVLNAGTGSGAAQAQYTTGLGLAISNLDRALDQLNVQRTIVGGGLREIDELNSAGEEVGLQYQAARARRMSLKAISDLNQQRSASTPRAVLHEDHRQRSSTSSSPQVSRVVITGRVESSGSSTLLKEAMRPCLAAQCPTAKIRPAEHCS
jgi:hypothetical protein